MMSLVTSSATGREGGNKRGLALRPAPCFIAGILQIRWHSVLGGRPARAAVASLMLVLWVVLVTLATCPQLHQLVHADSSQPSHDCLVTQLTKSQFLTASGIIAVTVAPFVFFECSPVTDGFVFPGTDLCIASPRGPPSCSFPS